MDKKEKIAHRVIFSLMIIGMVSCFIVSPTLLAFGIVEQTRAMVLASSICAIVSVIPIFAYAVFEQSIWASLVSIVAYIYGMGVGVSILGK
nr:MAG TPA: hypothetical protein [Caudoviricetes sp.]